MGIGRRTYDISAGYWPNQAARFFVRQSPA